MLTPVILSGGAGTRLWPLSRELYPKQLLPLTGTRTMLQETALRLEGLPASAAPVVVCNESAPLPRGRAAARSWRSSRAPSCSSPSGAIPRRRSRSPRSRAQGRQRRRSGPGAAGAAGRSRDPRRSPRSSAPCVRRCAAAAAGQLVTFGIVPDRARDRLRLHPARRRRRGRSMRIARFVEKPDAARAAEFLASGDYYWNSGMFMFRARALSRASCARHAPDDRARPASTRSPPRRAISISRASHAEAFAACPRDSIDYAVMEKTARRGGRAARRRLERRRLLGGAARCLTDGDAHGNVIARRRARRGFGAAATCYSDEPPGRGRRPQGSRRRRDQGCGAGGAARPGPGREEARRAAEGARAATSTRCIARCSGPGAATTASTAASASR